MWVSAASKGGQRSEHEEETLLSRSPRRAASQTCTWRVAPLEARTEATQAESGRAPGAHGRGCSSAGLRRAREARGRGGRMHGTSRRGAAPAPSRTRTRTRRAGCTVPALRPQGHCGQRPARQARARSAPGLLGLAPGRGGALRSLFKGKGWSKGCYATGGRGRGEERGNWDTRSLPAPIMRPETAFSFPGSPGALRTSTGY